MRVLLLLGGIAALGCAAVLGPDSLVSKWVMLCGSVFLGLRMGRELFRSEYRVMRWAGVALGFLILVEFMPTVLFGVADVPYQAWLSRQGHGPKATSLFGVVTERWAPTREGEQWSCRHADGREYLKGLGITRFHDLCQMASSLQGASGIMRVTRNGALQYVTLQGPLNSLSFAALGNVHRIEAASTWQYWLLLGNWSALFHGADRMAVACTRQECGVLSGAHLDRFVPLGADRILDMRAARGNITAFRRKDGWYTIDGTSTLSIRGPFAPGDLTMDYGDLFERRGEGWVCLTSARETRPKAVPLDEFPTEVAPSSDSGSALFLERP